MTLCQKFLGQGGNLLIEELLCLLPDPSVGAVIQGKKTGQECFTEHFGALARKQRWKVIDTDHAQRWSIFQLGVRDAHGGLVESSCDFIQRDRVERVGSEWVSLELINRFHIG